MTTEEPNNKENLRLELANSTANSNANGESTKTSFDRATRPSDVIVLEDAEADIEADRVVKKRKLIHSNEYRENLEIAMLSKIKKELEHITVEVVSVSLRGS